MNKLYVKVFHSRSYFLGPVDLWVYIYIYIYIGPPPVHQLGIMLGSAAVGSAQYRHKRQQQEKVRKALREEPG